VQQSKRECIHHPSRRNESTSARSRSARAASGCGAELVASRTYTCGPARASAPARTPGRGHEEARLSASCCGNQEARGRAQPKLVLEVRARHRLAIFRQRRRNVNCGGGGRQLGARRHEERGRLVERPKVSHVVHLQELRAHVRRAAHCQRDNVGASRRNQLQLQRVGRGRRPKARKRLRRCGGGLL